VSSRQRDKMARHISASVIAAMLISTAAIGQADCARFPRGSAAPVVEVCADHNQYRFRVGEIMRSFDRDHFERRLSAAIHGWLASHHESPDLVNQSIVEIWMTVPEANPEAAQPRAIVSTTKGQVAFWFDLSLNNWILSDKETSLLDDATYPESFGHRPRRVLVKAQPGIPAKDVAAALTSEGATEITSQGSDWYTAACQLFDESACANAALRNHQHVLKYVQVNSVVEWIADRQVAFSFPVMMPSE
jgi:hypothetical protein